VVTAATLAAVERFAVDGTNQAAVATTATATRADANDAANLARPCFLHTLAKLLQAQPVAVGAPLSASTVLAFLDAFAKAELAQHLTCWAHLLALGCNSVPSFKGFDRTRLILEMSGLDFSLEGQGFELRDTLARVDAVETFTALIAAP